MPQPSTSGGVDPSGNTRPVSSPLTVTQVQLITVVLIFIGWLITRGLPPYQVLLIASGGVTVSNGLLLVPRGLMRVVRAMGNAS